MKVEVLTRREELATISARWDELASQDRRDGFFRTFGWYDAWMRHIRPDAEPFVIIARDPGGHIVGVAPLCRLTYHDSGLHFTGLAWAGRDVVSGDFLDFVCEASARSQAVAAMLDYVWELRRKWSLLVLSELTVDGESCSAVGQFAQKTGMPVRFQEERLCPCIPLPESFDEYLNALGSSTRYHIRRRTRDVEKRGALVEVYSRPEEVASNVNTMMQLHLARWRKDNQPGTFARPGFAQFMRQICSAPPKGSSPRLYMLRHEGTPVASLLTFGFGDSVLYYQAGWDPESSLAGLSPGVVLMAHSIKDAIECGARYYEFLRGDEAYKSRWTKTHRRTTTLLVAQSFTARQFLRAARLKDLIKQRLPGPAELARGSDAGKGAYAET